MFCNIFLCFLCLLWLFNWRKNGGRVVSDTDGESGVCTEAGETFDTREVEPQTRRPDLHSEPRFALRLSAERAITRARVGPSVNFAGDGKLFVDMKDPGKPVCQNVVLRKQLGWRRENR